MLREGLLRYWRWAIGLGLAGSFFLTPLLAQAQEVPVQTFRRSGELLSKRVEVKAAEAVRLVCEGMAEDDLVVIRSRGKDVWIVGGVYRGAPFRRETQGSQPFSLFPLLSYAPLPEDALEVHGAEIVFRRPLALRGVVFLDISVPEGARVQWMVNGRAILDASVSEPLSFSGGRLGIGSRTVAETAVRAVFRDWMEDEVIPLSEPGEYAVSWRRLVVRKKVELGITAREVRRVILGIDEAGRVVRTLVFTDDGRRDAEVEARVRQWEFEPFLIDGRAVRVVTMLTLP